MRICSLLPSATEIVADLGLVDALVGVSEECRWPPEVVGKPVVTAPKRNLAELSSARIDETVRASLADGGSLYAVDADLIEALAPDVIVTQDLCPVCAVSSGDVTTACAVRGGGDLARPDDARGRRRLRGAARGALGVAEVGARVAAAMRDAIAEVADATRDAPRRRVFVAEWIEPPFTAGHWVPEMVAAAGGVDVLGRAGRPSRRTTWDEVLAEEPELVVLAACGFDADEALRRSAGLELPVPPWSSTATATSRDRPRVSRTAPASSPTCCTPGWCPTRGSPRTGSRRSRPPTGATLRPPRGYSSVGRAPGSHPGGRRFESA